MKRSRINRLLITLLIFAGCTCLKAQEYDFIKEIEQYRKEQNEEFMDPEKSPLTPKEQKNFKGHDFYPADPDYRVMAIFEATPKSRPFPLATSNGRTQLYRRIGILHFELKGKKLSLEAYEQARQWGRVLASDQVFLPVLDATSGETTYGAGRYMPVERGEKMRPWILDFNKLYNPFCAYNDRYVCPAVPSSNILDIAIEAGVRFENK